LAQLAPAACSLGSQVTPKKSRVMQTLRAHHGAKALVFCRFVELAEALHALAAEARLQSHVIHGQLGQHEMLSRMAAFRWDRSVDLAFMTRDLGGRGLDFPDARHLVLYSPRSDFTSADQEVCRIRSNRDDPKPVYLLYYARTAEESKAQALLAKMSSAHTVGGHNAYEIRETSPH
jgi:superfamily II DNA/RNA helicase